MNSIERTMAAINHTEPDKVPLFLLLSLNLFCLSVVVALRLVEVGGEHLKLDPRVDIFRMSLQPSGLGGESRVGLDHAFLEADSRGAEILLSATYPTPNTPRTMAIAAPNATS